MFDQMVLKRSNSTLSNAPTLVGKEERNNSTSLIGPAPLLDGLEKLESQYSLANGVPTVGTLGWLLAKPKAAIIRAPKIEIPESFEAADILESQKPPQVKTVGVKSSVAVKAA